MSDSACRVQALSENGPVKIGYCHDCQVYHLQVGYITLHLNPEGFAGLGATVNAALAIVQRHEAGADESPSVPSKGKSALH